MCNCDLFVSSSFLPFVPSFLPSCPFLYSSVKRYLLLFLEGHIFINLVILFEGTRSVIYYVAVTCSIARFA